MSQPNDDLTLKQNKNAGQNENANTLVTETRQDFIPMPVSFQGGDPSTRLMSTKIVRIRFATKCSICTKGCKKLFYQVNTVSKIDDLHPEAENEIPLFDVEELPQCNLCETFCPPLIKFELVDAGSKQQFSVFETRATPDRVRVCCGDSYYVFPPVFNFKSANQNDVSIVERYDTRSFYRTFGYPEKPLYKIGEPYVPVEVTCTCRRCCAAIPCCAGCCDETPVKDEPCCDGCCKSCCPATPVDKRRYIDIFNMANQNVGKYAEFFDVQGCCCCVTKTLFYEVYFPADANDMLRLALLSQMILFLHFQQNMFGILPGSRDNVSQFI